MGYVIVIRPDEMQSMEVTSDSAMITGIMDTSELFNRINDGVVSERIHAIARNIGMNKNMICRYGGLSPVVNELKNRHCVIVGAGASLECGISDLRRIAMRNSVAVISTDMAYRALVRQGITPSYAISCETTTRDFFSGCDTSKSILLAFSGVCPRIVREWKGEVRFYNWMVKGGPYDELWKRAGVELGFVATGSSVSTQAVSMAMGCGIKSMLLVGNDFGFYDSMYARGVIRNDDIYRAATRSSTVPTIAFGQCRAARHYIIKREKNYYTNHQFLAAKQWLESLFLSHGFGVCDAGIPGCAGKNIEKMNVRDYAERIVGSGR